MLPKVSYQTIDQPLDFSGFMIGIFELIAIYVISIEGKI